MGYFDALPIFKNFVEVELKEAVATSDTLIRVTDIEKFPRVIQKKDFLPCVIRDVARSRQEVVYVTDVDYENDSLTVVRGREGTEARNWPVGTTYLYLAFTAGTVQRLRAGGFAPVLDEQGNRPTIKKISNSKLQLTGVFTEIEAGIAVRLMRHGGGYVVPGEDTGIFASDVTVSDGTTMLEISNGVVPDDIVGVDIGIYKAALPGTAWNDNTYIIPEGGTHARTLNNILGDVVNVKNFGAQGDGETDDTAALNEAVTAAMGKTLFLPAGTYMTSTGLRIPSNTKVCGAGMDQTIIKLSDDALHAVDGITNEQNWWNYPEAISTYGGFTQALQELNQGNVNICVEDLTVDGNCSRTDVGSGHTGSAVHFANVRHLRMRNVRGINGRLHGIDISSSMYTSCYDETGFRTEGGDTYGPWYVGYSDDVVLENCEGVDPLVDDCITTHYSRNITLINPRAVRNLTSEQASQLSANQHGIEIDDGSYNVHVYGGYAENCYEGLQIKGHGTAYPAHDVVVDGMTVRNCINNFFITCGGTVDYSRGRNITLANCTSYQTVASNEDPDMDDDSEIDAVNGQHLYACEYDNIFIRNFRCIGNGVAARSIAFQLSRSCRNVVVDNVSFKDVPLTVDATTGDVGTLIYLNSSIGSNVMFRGIHADNCLGGHVFRTTVVNHGVVVDGVSAYRTTDNGSSAVFVSQGTARNPETIIRNIVTSGYQNTYSEGTTSDFNFSQNSNREYAVIGEAETLWKRAISSGIVDPADSYAFNVGWYAETQDVQENERLLIGFKNKVRGEDEKYIGYIGSNHDTPGDITGKYGLIFGTTNEYVLGKRWEIRFDGRLVPCVDETPIGYSGGGYRPDVYAHNVYTDSGTISISDETLKSNIVQIPDAVLDAWADVQWVQYQFNSAIEKKGENNARLHMGAVAQRIKAVFESHGLDAFRYGLICLDEWTAEDSGDGTPGSMYTLRYEECLVVEAAYQRRKISTLEARLAALESSQAV